MRLAIDLIQKHLQENTIKCLEQGVPSKLVAVINLEISRAAACCMLYVGQILVDDIASQNVNIAYLQLEKSLYTFYDNGFQNFQKCISIIACLFLFLRHLICIPDSCTHVFLNLFLIIQTLLCLMLCVSWNSNNETERLNHTTSWTTTYWCVNVYDKKNLVRYLT